MSVEEIFERLQQTVIVGDTEGAAKAAKDSIGKIEPWKAITDGLAKGMEVVGEKYESKEYFLPEVLTSSEAMYAGLELLLPLLKTGAEGADREKVVIGVVEGDIHDIGKNIVKAMLTAGGYDVIDVGRDVPTPTFVETASGEKAKVIAMSTMMTPTLMSMKDVEDELAKKGLKGEVKTIIGGGTVTDEWKAKIGSDAYGEDAVQAVDKVKMLFQEIKTALELAKKKKGT